MKERGYGIPPALIREARLQAQALSGGWPGLLCLILAILAMCFLDVGRW